MDRRAGIIIASVVGLILIGLAFTAWFALRKSNEILEEFKQIDQHLDSVHYPASDRREETRAMMETLVCPEMAAQADSLHQAYLDLNERIEGLRSQLETSPMDDVDVADSLFNSNGLGLELYKGFNAFFAMAERFAKRPLS